MTNTKTTSLQSPILIERYSSAPDRYREMIHSFMQQSVDEGNDSIRPERYDPDNPDIETWMCFLEGKLISISAAEKSHYTGDPDVAVRVCRYHILKDYRFTHCGLRMGEHQIKWAREQGYQILYITHDRTKRAINALYQRKKRMVVQSFDEFTHGEWYNSLTLETVFQFQTGPIIQNVYSIRLQDPEFVWKPESKHIVPFDANPS